MNSTTSYSRPISHRTRLYIFALLVVFSSKTYAQEDVRIFLDSTAQVIRGFGAANIVGWRPDMTDEEIETAFGVGEGKLGFSLLRLRISPQEDQWASNVSTARRAHAMGVNIIASPWSPPASMKTNNSLVGGRLRDDMYDDYAEHLDSFNSYMSDNGVPLYAISVQNEPDIEVSYESCDWSPEEMRRFVEENASSIGTKIIAPESFQFRREMSDPLLNDAEAAANLDIVGGHIYGGGLAPYPLAEEKGKELWMTEHLTESQHSGNVWAYAMDVGTEIQAVMKSNMNAYIWWYIVRYYGPIADGETSDTAPEEDYGEKGEITKKGYVMAQFARFIRPGFVRVHTKDPITRPISRVSVTAYKDSSKVVIVAINDEAAPKEVNFILEGGTAGPFSRYVTSETQNVEKMDDIDVSDNSFTVVLEANSVTTFVSDYTAVSNEAVAAPEPSHQLLQNYPNPFSSATAIGYTVPQTSDVTLEVFDLLGRKVATLVDGRVSAGSHHVTFNASRLSGGVYVYQLKAEDVVQTRRMTLIK